MCGIIGYSGENLLDISKIKILFLFNESRGTDSCGLYTEKTGIIKKEGKSSANLLPSLTKDIKCNYLIGHTRQGSVGFKKDVEYSHPFQYGKFIGVHNGKIDNWISICNKYDVPTKDIDIDSQSIYACMSKTNNISDVIKHLRGSMALLFTDNSGILYVYRNKERPLYHGVSNGGLYISSLKEALETIDAISIKEFKENYLYKIKDGKILSTNFIKQETPPPPATNNYNPNHSGAGYHNNYSRVPVNTNTQRKINIINNPNQKLSETSDLITLANLLNSELGYAMTEMAKDYPYKTINTSNQTNTTNANLVKIIKVSDVSKIEVIKPTAKEVSLYGTNLNESLSEVIPNEVLNENETDFDAVRQNRWDKYQAIINRLNQLLEDFRERHFMGYNDSYIERDIQEIEELVKNEQNNLVNEYN